MAKKRTPIPAEIAASLMFSSDHTCCVCRDRGRPVQIHHIDENPSNHSRNNLAVLCLICHDETQTKGGFSRKLRAAEIVEYRNDWHQRVQSRRDRADEIAASRQSGTRAAPMPSTADEAAALEIPVDEALSSYIQTLPMVLSEAYAKARPGWDSGVTVDMVQASHELIDVLTGIWLHLSSWFPRGHFGGTSGEEYFSDYVASRFRWHRAINEPDGVGLGGTIVNVVAASSVVSDIEATVEQTVEALLDDGMGIGPWRVAWAKAKSARSSAPS